jgi:hypothetical protein
MWLMSVGRCVDNLLNAAGVAPEALPTSRAMTLPAIRVTMAELIAAIGEGARGEGGGADGARAAPAVTYQPDAALERAFGAYPPLTTVVAEAAGFRNDGDIASLVDRVLADLA